MSQIQLFIGIDNHLALLKLTVTDHVVNIGSRIRTGIHKGNFLDVAVKDIAALLLQAVCIDRQRVDVAMFNGNLGTLSLLGVVKGAIGTDAFLLIVQKRLTQNILRVIVLMIPYKGNGLAVTVLEGILTNGAAVRAENIVSRRPSAEIVLHFDLLPPL